MQKMFDWLQQIDLDIVKFLQRLSNPVLDWIMLFITEFGDMFVFMVLLVLLYWLFDKKRSYQFFFAVVISGFFNTIIKKIVERPRPYQQGAISIGDKTHGASFPSGHSQLSGVIGFSIHDFFKPCKFAKYLAIAWMILVPLSRIYLGQHFLSDVIVGVVLGYIIAALIFKAFRLFKDKEHIYPLFAIPIVIIFTYLLRNETMYVMGPAYVGVVTGYFFEKKYVKYQVPTTWVNRVLVVVVGALGLGIIYVLLGYLISTNDTMQMMIRYFMMSLWAFLGAPYVFKKMLSQVKD